MSAIVSAIVRVLNASLAVVCAHAVYYGA